MSNLSYVSKVIEKCVHRPVIVHLESTSLLDRYQSAYKANHNCETALVKIHNDINTLLCSLKIIYAFDDIRKQFDDFDGIRKQDREIS